MVKIAAVKHLKRVFSHLERDSKKQAENFFRDFFTKRQQKMGQCHQQGFSLIRNLEKFIVSSIIVRSLFPTWIAIHF